MLSWIKFGDVLYKEQNDITFTEVITDRFHFVAQYIIWYLMI